MRHTVPDNGSQFTPLTVNGAAVSETHEKATLYSRCAVNTTCTDVGSADIAYVQGWTVVGQCRSNCRGAYICRPCKLDCSILATVKLEYRVAFSCVTVICKTISCAYNSTLLNSFFFDIYGSIRIYNERSWQGRSS
jgi:hypothetical protein